MHNCPIVTAWTSIIAVAHERSLLMNRHRYIRRRREINTAVASFTAAALSAGIVLMCGAGAQAAAASYRGAPDGGAGARTESHEQRRSSGASSADEDQQQSITYGKTKSVFYLKPQTAAEHMVSSAAAGSPKPLPSGTTGGRDESGARMLTLVNADNPLPDDFVPTLSKIGGHKFDSAAVSALSDMLNAAKAEGLTPIICSAYRSIDRQATLFERKVAQYTAKGYTRIEAEKLAAEVVARPGTSEHNLGLAADIVALSYQLLETEQEDTAETKWLHENCHRFGFIVRYPEDKKDVTGIIYEPWHYRYVGVEAATEIMESGLCLEEYLEKLNEE